ncbi:MAG: serine protease [Pseudomonadota bacterium]
MIHGPRSFRRALCLLWLVGSALLLTACAETRIKPASTHYSVTATPQAANLVAHHAHIDCRSPDYETLDAIVRVASITTNGGDGSGVVVAPNVVLTAAHVLEGASVGLVYIGNHYKEATVLGRDAYSDLALLMVGTENLQPIQISDRGLVTNESVWAVGFPLALDQSTTKGQFYRYRNGGLLTSAGIDAGSSGGGLLHCERGTFKLAGMIRSYLARVRQGEAVAIPNRSISVPADAIEAFINLHGVSH